ncbi:MAG: AAA family ATPase [Gammaproteobacteria bacterium]|nr:AAA family ATPase [Gammaproteobacteria bacterium]
MPLDNRIIVASAGSGKTTLIVDDACGLPEKRAAMITYTNNGRDEIEAKTYSRLAHVPPHVSIGTWFSFLLRHFVRPYQNCLYDLRVAGIHFVSGQSTQYIAADKIRHHYFSKPELIYSDKIAKFACEVVQKMNGAPIKRFEQIFERLFIDESQDLAGYDLDLVELLMRSQVQIILVGDHRQATYATNSASKNKKYRGAKIVDKFHEWEKADLCALEYHNYNHRCVQNICDFADQLHPAAPNTESKNTDVTGHDGVFAVRKSDVASYIEKFKPQTLRYNRKTKNVIGHPLNFGAAKGMTFDRTIIYPHGPLKKFLTTGKLADAGKELDKIYVAITRARQSVAFVVEDNAKLVGLAFYEIE